jgi:hypothetical protein
VRREKQFDWLATNTDDITTQSHSLFACRREKNRQVENSVWLKLTLMIVHFFKLSHSLTLIYNQPQDTFFSIILLNSKIEQARKY